MFGMLPPSMGGMGGAIGGDIGLEVRTVIIPIQHVDVTHIAALFGVGGQPMSGGGMMPGMGGGMAMPGMGGAGSGGARMSGAGGATGAAQPPKSAPAPGQPKRVEVRPSSEGKISVDFQNAPIAEVVNALIKVRPDMNVLLEPDVVGTVTLTLNKVYWDEALRLAAEQVEASMSCIEMGKTSTKFARSDVQ